MVAIVLVGFPIEIWLKKGVCTSSFWLSTMQLRSQTLFGMLRFSSVFVRIFSTLTYLARLHKWVYMVLLSACFSLVWRIAYIDMTYDTSNILRRWDLWNPKMFKSWKSILVFRSFSLKLVTKDISIFSSYHAL